MNKQPAGYTQALRKCWLELGISAEQIEARGLPEYTEPGALILAETDADGREHLLTPDAAQAWRRMKRAAASDAIEIFIVSAFRSVRRQIELIERKLSAGETPEDILNVVAPPGCSEHHSGRAIDIGTTGSPVLEVDFETTPAWDWLASNAEYFGYVLSYPRDNRWGYTYEPWHWCFAESAPARGQGE